MNRLLLIAAAAVVCSSTLAQTTKPKPAFKYVVAMAHASAAAGIGLQNSNNDLDLTISADKQQVKIGENVTLTVKVKNVLTPLQPITLQATATYTDAVGTQRTATSNAVIVQPIQPISVATVTLTLPVGWEFVSGTSTLQFGATLLEGQEESRQVVIRRRP